jgi:hypothetical protein
LFIQELQEEHCHLVVQQFFIPLHKPPQPLLQVLPIQVLDEQAQLGVQAGGQYFVPAQVPPQPLLQVLPIQVLDEQAQLGVQAGGGVVPQSQHKLK